MTSLNSPRKPEYSSENAGFSSATQFLLTVVLLVVALYILYLGFIFLRDSEAHRGIVALVAIVWGVGGIAFLYWIINSLVEKLPGAWTTRLQPFVFVGPAIGILAWYLAIPTIRTFWISLFDRDGPDEGLSLLEQLSSDTFIGLSNYASVFTERLMIESFRNNLMWIVFGSTLSVILGLLIAVLADRSRFEKLAKSLIFLPMAISFVGASVIWNFIYEFRPVEQTQIGLLNSIVVSLGGRTASMGTMGRYCPI